MRRITAAVVLFFVLLVCRPGEAGIFRCATGDAQCLIDAIEASNGNVEANTIRLEPGVYPLIDVNNSDAPSNSPNGLPVILGNVAIVGAGADVTVIERTSAAQAFRIFSVGSSGTLVLDGLTVRGGNARFPGWAGALDSKGTVTISRSVVRENRADICGVIRHTGAGTLTIHDTRLVQNSVGLGGDLVCAGHSIYGAASTVVIERTSIADNQFSEGYALTVLSDSSAIISNSTIANNRLVGVGGGIDAAGPVTIVNSTIANNRAGADGGGIAARSAGVRIINSTIVHNRWVGVIGPAHVLNTIVADNENVDCNFQGGVTSLGHNILGNPLNCGWLLSSDLTGDPGLTGFVDTGRPGGGVFRLRADSRAIDAGDNVGCLPVDQQGLTRPIDGSGNGVRACDIGATEFYPVVNDLVEQSAVDFKYPGGELRITATFRNPDTHDICSVAFEVSTLQRQAGAPPLLLTKRGELIGAQGVIVPATLADAKPDLEAHKQARYVFRVGLGQQEPITFSIDVLGEATAGPCVN